MTAPRAIDGDFADVRSVKTRSCIQMIIEIPIERGEELIRMFGFPQPGNPVRVAVARLQTNLKEVTPDTSTIPNAGSFPGHKNGAGEKRDWSSLSPAQQAGIRCNEPAFHLFLRDDGASQCDSAEKAAEYVRFATGVRSRSDIGQSNEAIQKWNELEAKYQAWRIAPAVGAA